MKRVVWLASACVLVCGAAAAQHALAASSRVGGGRVNPKQPTATMSRPIYTLNHHTGEFVYNRANAFNDPAYTIYQRRTIDLFDRAPASLSRTPGKQRAHTAPLRPVGASSASALHAPRYGAHGGARAPSLRQPTYRASARL